nr:MAG TPA: hypothetical protein [Caudoviricetes sp.]
MVLLVFSNNSAYFSYTFTPPFRIFLIVITTEM